MKHIQYINEIPQTELLNVCEYLFKYKLYQIYNDFQPHTVLTKQYVLNRLNEVKSCIMEIINELKNIEFHFYTSDTDILIGIKFIFDDFTHDLYIHFKEDLLIL